MHAYPTNKEILNENQQKKYCYTFPLCSKGLLRKFHFKSFCSLYTLQLMAFAFCNIFWEHSPLIYRNLINQLLKFVILIITWESFLEVIHNGLSGFLKHLGSLIKLCRWYVPKKFYSSTADSVISELKSHAIRNCCIFTFTYPIFVR